MQVLYINLFRIYPTRVCPFSVLINLPYFKLKILIVLSDDLDTIFLLSKLIAIELT